MEEVTRHDPLHPDAFREQIPAYLAGMLDERSTSLLEQHLPGCEACRSDLEQLRTLWENLPDRAPQTAPIDFWPPLRSRLERERLVALPVPQPHWRLALSFAAGLVAGLGLWILGTGGPAPSSAATDELLAHETIFENLDPIPPESMAGLYLSLLTLEEEPEGGGS